GQRLAFSSFGTAGGGLQIWDFTNDIPSPKSITKAPVLALAYSPDGRRIASWSGDGITLWDSDSGKKLLLMESLVSPVGYWADPGRLDVLFSRDSKRIASVEPHSQSLVIWSAISGKQVASVKRPNVLLPEPRSPIDVFGLNSGAMLAFHPSGRTLFAPLGNLVQIWNEGSSEPLLTLRESAEQVTGVKLTADGSRLAAFSADGTVRIWDSRSAYNPDAESLVESLFQQLHFASDVSEKLNADTSLDESLRGAALLLVQEQGDHDPSAHVRAAWETAKAPGGRRDALELALRHARVACQLSPWDWKAFNVQGAVQYRLGAYSEALSSLLHAAELRARPAPTNLALQALTYYGLGEISKAKTALSGVRGLARNTDMDPADLIEETELRVEGRVR
ncbi:MAG: WD40 repeat domain-containing protein, partial [Bryobacteraceae bacterium]